MVIPVAVTADAGPVPSAFCGVRTGQQSCVRRVAGKQGSERLLYLGRERLQGLGRTHGGGAVLRLRRGVALPAARHPWVCRRRALLLDAVQLGDHELAVPEGLMMTEPLAGAEAPPLRTTGGARLRRAASHPRW